MNAKLALLDCTEGFDECGHVKNVTQALAVGLKEKREGWVTRCDAKEVIRSLAELPEG